jgi:hypothetical protein
VSSRHLRDSTHAVEVNCILFSNTHLALAESSTNPKVVYYAGIYSAPFSIWLCWSTPSLFYEIFHGITWHDVSLHNIKLHCVTLHYITWHDISWHYITVCTLTWYYITVIRHSTTWHYVSLYCIKWHRIKWKHSMWSHSYHATPITSGNSLENKNQTKHVNSLLSNYSVIYSDNDSWPDAPIQARECLRHLTLSTN